MLLKEKRADLWCSRGDTLLSLNDLKYHAADSRFQFTSVKFHFTGQMTILNKTNQTYRFKYSLPFAVIAAHKSCLPSLRMTVSERIF